MATDILQTKSVLSQGAGYVLKLERAWAILLVLEQALETAGYVDQPGSFIGGNPARAMHILAGESIGEIEEVQAFIENLVELAEGTEEPSENTEPVKSEG